MLGPAPLLCALVVDAPQDGRPAMEEAARRGIVVHNAGSLASGLLAGGYTYAYNVRPRSIRVTGGWMRQTKRQRQRETERKTETERERQRQRVSGR